MKHYLNGALFVMMCSLFAACGSSENPVSIPGTPAPQETIYQTNATASLSSRTPEGVAVQEYQIMQGSLISILEEKSSGLLRVGIESSDDSQEVLDLWVNASELESLNLSAVDDVDPFDEFGFDLEPTDELDLFALRKKMTYCYRYVKQYLLKHGLVKVYLPGASAYMAAKELPKHGFKKVSRKPASAIVNDVCVYRGGPSGHGHIEVRTSKGWYYGYGYKASPIQNRTLISCFHK